MELPRAEILSNAFVLRPLAELNPELVHPRLGLSVAALWQAYEPDRQPLTPVMTEWQFFVEEHLIRV